MKAALLSNVNSDSLAARLALEEGCGIYTPAGYNVWLQELTDPASAFYAAKPEAAFIILDGRELLGAARDASDAEAILSPMLETIAAAARASADPVFAAASLDIPQSRVQPLASERIETHSAAFWRRTLEAYEIPIIELAEIAADMGRERFYNKRVWYMGGIPFSRAGEAALIREIRRVMNAIRGRRKKCLALDLDNTLWGGVIGETGAEGVELSETGSGARYRDMQRRILDLKRQGVLLAVVSKNNLEDALEGISSHPAMLLRENDFAAIRANWEPKPTNLESIANELNIGLDSFVFIDDNPLERETMKITLPQVTVPDFPADTALLERFITDVAREHFLLLRTTSEDLGKTEQYRAESKRQSARGAYASVRDYLRSLEMTLRVERLNAQNLPRAAQLTQKTNQFNLTTRRYSEADMRAILADETRRVYIGGLSDKFGDYGKIILAIARISGERAEIEAFLMSCRVMGRGVEEAFLRFVEDDLAALGARELEASYIPTAKNGVTARFWPAQGYRPLASEDDFSATSASAARYENKLSFPRDNDNIINIINS